MTTLQKALIAAGAVVVVGGIIGASVLSKPKEKGEEVYMAKAAVKDLVSFVSATGRIEARTKVNVQSSVIGEIVDLPVKEGDVVRKGDLLVQIDRERYRTEVDRLESVVRTQRIAIEQAEVALANSERQHKRNTALFGTSGLVSQAELDRSELDLRQRQIDLRSLQEQVAQAQASLARSRDDLSKTTIRSVIDGTVTKLNAEKGEITMTGTMNNAGTVIMIVSDMGEVLATVDVDETRVTQLQVGQAARVVVDAVGEAKPYTGKVVEIAGSAVQRPGQQTQVFEVKIALDTVDAKLRPGMTAKARVETQRLDQTVAIPIQAVMLRPSKDLEAKPYTGKVVEIAGSAIQRPGQQTQVFEVKIALDTVDAKLRPGMTAKARVETQRLDQAVAIPIQAVMLRPSKDFEAKPGDDAKKDKDAAKDAAPVSIAAASGAAKTADTKECVYVVEKGKAALRQVTSGISDETSVAITSGLKDGETVVTGPYRALRDLKSGDAVKEKKSEDTKSKKDDDSVQVEVD